MSPEDRSDQASPPAPNFFAFERHYKRLFGFMMAKPLSSRRFHALAKSLNENQCRIGS
jgi:hypothetical protein